MTYPDHPGQLPMDAAAAPAAETHKKFIFWQAPAVIQTVEDKGDAKYVAFAVAMKGASQTERAWLNLSGKNAAADAAALAVQVAEAAATGETVALWGWSERSAKNTDRAGNPTYTHKIAGMVRHDAAATVTRIYKGQQVACQPKQVPPRESVASDLNVFELHKADTRAGYEPRAYADGDIIFASDLQVAAPAPVETSAPATAPVAAAPVVAASADADAIAIAGHALTAAMTLVAGRGGSVADALALAPDLEDYLRTRVGAAVPAADTTDEAAGDDELDPNLVEAVQVGHRIFFRPVTEFTAEQEDDLKLVFARFSVLSEPWAADETAADAGDTYGYTVGIARTDELAAWLETLGRTLEVTELDVAA